MYDLILMAQKIYALWGELLTYPIVATPFEILMGTRERLVVAGPATSAPSVLNSEPWASHTQPFASCVSFTP